MVGCRNNLDCGPEFGINWQKLVCDHGICVPSQCTKHLHPEFNAVSKYDIAYDAQYTLPYNIASIHFKS